MVKQNSVIEMKKSWLIQRLSKPYAGTNEKFRALGEVFSFGGGLVNGGFSKDAMALLRPIMEFDYMGSAEFEWGAVPKALGAMASQELEAFSMKVTLPSKTGHCWATESADACESMIYVICPKGWRVEVTNRIQKFSTESNQHMKEIIMLESSIRTQAKGVEKHRMVGWLELDNGFFFSIDKEMWKKLCTLFEVTS